MKLAVIIACLAVAVVAMGAPPVSISGMKFRHSVRGVNFFDITRSELLLNANGTSTGLLTLVWREQSVPGGTSSGTLTPVLVDISIPPNGTWTYRVLNHSAAEIVLDGRTLRLHFDDDKTSGYVGEPMPGRFQDGFSLEAYDDSPRIINCSTRSYVALGRSVSLGFVIAGGERRVLLRAIGPGLRLFGISQPLENPLLRIYEAGSRIPLDVPLPPASRATLNEAARRAGTFPLPSLDDAGKFLTLQEGAYIAEVTASPPDTQTSGEVVLEVYQLP